MVTIIVKYDIKARSKLLSLFHKCFSGEKKKKKKKKKIKKKKKKQDSKTFLCTHQGPVVQILTKFLANLTFCSKNINVFENILATTVNKSVINKLVKLMML